MGKPRTFTTLPVAVIADTRLTALDIRCLAVIALHDGMSGPKGAGGGCFARNATLAALARTDVTNFSKSLARLIRLGYVSREPQIMDKRRFTLRVQYPSDESWRTDQQSGAQEVGEPTNDQPEIVGEDANHATELVGDADSKSGSFSNGNGRDYIPLKGEIDFDESNKINSAKRRDFAVAGRSGNHFKDHLPANFADMKTPAKVACVDRAYTAVGRRLDAITTEEDFRQRLTDWLFWVNETYADDPTGMQAGRLYQEMVYDD